MKSPQSQLRNLALLCDGWDSNGARPLDRRLLKRMAWLFERKFLDGRTWPWVIPKKNGGITLSWDFGGGLILEWEMKVKK